MKKIIFCFIILLSVSTIAYAKDGTMDIAWIEVGGGYNPQIGGPDPPYCGAHDDDTGFSIGNDTDNPCTTVRLIHVVEKGKSVTATCKFTDEGFSQDTSWQEWKVVNCNLISEIGTFCGGTGKITRTADRIYNPVVGAYTGGDAEINCVFELPAPCPD